jgi:hypothetical protein
VLILCPLIFSLHSLCLIFIFLFFFVPSPFSLSHSMMNVYWLVATYQALSKLLCMWISCDAQNNSIIRHLNDCSHFYKWGNWGSGRLMVLLKTGQ